MAEPTRRRTQSSDEESENSEPPATPCCIPLSELLDLSGPVFFSAKQKESIYPTCLIGKLERPDELMDGWESAVET